MTRPQRGAHCWAPQPEAESVVRAVFDDALARTPPARLFQSNLLNGCSIRLRDIIDHFALADGIECFKRAGWECQAPGLWRHPGGRFPDIVERDRACIAFRVESVEHFLQIADIDALVEGAPHGPYRRARVFAGDAVSFDAIERNGCDGFEDPRPSARMIRRARLHLQVFRTRRRQFRSGGTGLSHLGRLVEAAVSDLGAHWACALFMRAEREFWAAHNEAGSIQTRRQEKTGVGWCNIDHTTYDSSRENVHWTITILEKLGYERREIFYAGYQAGWGSQILEQPTLRSTVFADVDLAPFEVGIDLGCEPMSPLTLHRRAGLWCAMHGESMLDGGPNHVAGLYDQAILREQLSARGITMMPPFSDIPHLYQELTVGQWRAVDPLRVNALERNGYLGAEEAEEIRLCGAIATHLESVERNQGYKGFNQRGIDAVLRVIDPRAVLASVGGEALADTETGAAAIKRRRRLRVRRAR